jgi:[acyl-carrier-protein] S-malonyltransferase
MASAVAPFADALRRHGFTDPSIPVLSGISAELIFNADKAVADCMNACVEASLTVALEPGGGRGIVTHAAWRHPQTECRAVNDFRSLGGLRKWLARHHD